MRIGLAYDFLSGARPMGEEFVEALATIRLAEAVGFDSVWAGETHRRRPGSGHAPTPFLVCAALASATTRIRIGTAVALLPAYTPLAVAEQGAVVDQLSRGRFVLGVAPGLEIYKDFGFENLGVPRGGLQAVMDESLALVRRFWAEAAVSHAGGRYRYDGAACVPAPWQRPHPPILVGGITPASIERSARLGDGWIGGTPYPRPLLERVGREYRDACARAGRSPGSFALIRPIAVAADPAAGAGLAERAIGPLLRFYRERGAYMDYEGKAVTAEDDPVFRRALDEVGIAGTPDACVRAIEGYRDRVGVDHLILRVRLPGFTHDDTRRAVRLIGETVLPRLRGGG